MAKREDRPAISGFPFLFELLWEKIGATPIKKGSPIMFLPSGARIRQKWISRDKKDKSKITEHSERTYLHKGIFLAPIWQEVPIWEIEYYFTRMISPRTVGMHCIDYKYYRLIFQQDEDLNHLFRQLGYAMENCADVFGTIPDDLGEVETILYEKYHIAKVISERREQAKSMHYDAKNTVERHHRQLEKMLETDALTNKYKRESTIKILRNMVIYCESIKFKPLYTHLYQAKRSLNSAIGWLQTGNSKLATKRVQSAIKNMIYPTT